MSRNLGDKQKWLLSLAYGHEQRHGGEPAPITRLSEAFFDEGGYHTSIESWEPALYAKSVLFQTRRAIQALIRRGLMEEAGTAISETGGDTITNGGCYCPKGYTRVCKTYRLTDAGRVIGKAEHEATLASVRAIEEANPKLKEAAERVRAALESLR